MSGDSPVSKWGFPVRPLDVNTQLRASSRPQIDTLSAKTAGGPSPQVFWPCLTRVHLPEAKIEKTEAKPGNTNQSLA